MQTPEVSRDDPSRCIHCIKRDEICEFKQAKRRFKLVPQRTSREPSSPNGNRPSREHSCVHDEGPAKPTIPSLFVDHLLDSQPTQSLPGAKVTVLRSQEHEISSSNLAFFSDRKIQSLTQRLGNTRLRELVECIETAIEGRVTAQGVPSISPVTFKKPTSSARISNEAARGYVDVYFQRIHPLYPFLDRKSFEETAFDPGLPRTLENNAAFSALYHAVLASGCQYRDGGTFDPGKGKAWRFFQMSLGLMADILVPRESLLNLQALTAMAIFAMNTCCLQIDEILIMEAARMALALRYHKANHRDSDRLWCQRTFWVIYAMEKQLAFQNRETSLISDYDVGCPIPETPDAIFGSYNWFLAAIRFSRITSQAYEVLFSTSAARNSAEACYASIDHIQDRLEKWRLSVPAEFRPGDSSHSLTFTDPTSKMVALQTHYSYYSLVIGLARLTLQIGPDDEARHQDSKRTLVASARRIIEMTQYIDKAAHIPLFILAIMPLVALFILFDIVVHNPTHPETKTNLAMLDVVSGHFALVEHASNGSLPSSLVSEFAHIARQHENNVPSLEIEGELEQYAQTDSFYEPGDYLYYPRMDDTFNLGNDPILPGIDLRTLFGTVIPHGLGSPEDSAGLGGMVPTPPSQ
ncbi:hypothetical protein BBP40_009986 [Aspergillus hancockii]|nr:hypothetical protein BBP40_009986 [Aspergillus hancockii]